MKIVIAIQGGEIRTVLCDEDAEVEVLDFDSIETAKDGDELEAKLDSLIEELIEVL